MSETYDNHTALTPLLASRYPYCPRRTDVFEANCAKYI